MSLQLHSLTNPDTFINWVSIQFIELYGLPYIYTVQFNMRNKDKKMACTLLLYELQIKGQYKKASPHRVNMESFVSKM